MSTSGLAAIAAVAAASSLEFISIKSSAAPGADKPGIMEGTAEVPHPIADAHLP
jgi:hypothetical protein